MTPACSEPCKRESALFGVALLLFALALVAASTIPALQQARRLARARATIADLRQFQAAFQAYAHDRGDWPAGGAAPGAIPPGMDGVLAASNWVKSAPIGGSYVWLIDTLQCGERPRAAIAIVSTASHRVSDDARQLAALREQAGAGGLDPSRLRLGFRNEPILVLEY